MRSSSPEIDSWLNTKFNDREHGIFLDRGDLASFELIQDFLETKEHPVKTPVIYYQAFADEGLEEFIGTLEEELRSKLGYHHSQSCSTMAEVIAKAELKTIVIDRSYLCTQEMLDGLWKWLAEYQVGLILVISQTKTRGSQILSHPIISRWDKFMAGASLVSFPCALTSSTPNLIA